MCVSKRETWLQMTFRKSIRNSFLAFTLPIQFEIRTVRVGSYSSAWWVSRQGFVKLRHFYTLFPNLKLPKQEKTFNLVAMIECACCHALLEKLFKKLTVSGLRRDALATV